LLSLGLIQDIVTALCIVLIGEWS